MHFTIRQHHIYMLPTLALVLKNPRPGGPGLPTLALVLKNPRLRKPPLSSPSQRQQQQQQQQHSPSHGHAVRSAGIVATAVAGFKRRVRLDYAAYVAGLCTLDYARKSPRPGHEGICSLSPTESSHARGAESDFLHGISVHGPEYQ